jgi:hypothetical protein
MLPQRPHLRDPQDLRQRQMGADDPQRAAVLAQIGNDRAAMAMPGQIEQRDALHLDARVPGRRRRESRGWRRPTGLPVLRWT